MKFTTWREMYDYIVKENDLYNPNVGIYVFEYNAFSALCVYYIDEDEAKELSQLSRDNGDYWAAFLGVGGTILDNYDYRNGDEIKNEELDLYLEPSYDFCKEYYNKDGWISTKDYK